jgi:hypothetical protein
MNISQLPQEIIQYILSFIDYTFDVKSCILASKLFHCFSYETLDRIVKIEIYITESMIEKHHQKCNTYMNDFIDCNMRSIKEFTKLPEFNEVRYDMRKARNDTFEARSYINFYNMHNDVVKNWTNRLFSLMKFYGVKPRVFGQSCPNMKLFVFNSGFQLKRSIHLDEIEAAYQKAKVI